MSASMAHSPDSGALQLITPAAEAASRHLGHSLAIEPNLANTFYPREHIIYGLAADSHQFRPDDSRYKITRQIQNLLRRRAFEPLAENRSHRASERLHFPTESHANVRLALFIYVQINAYCVCAFFVLTHIDKVELLAFARFLSLCVVCIRNECLAP